MPNGRGRPPPPPLTLAQPPVATLAPRCAQRSAGSGGPPRHGRLCRRPGRPVPAESPSRALGIQGEGKGAVSPRRAGAPGPNGVRPKASQSAKDFLIQLPERDTSGVMKKPLARKENRLCGWSKGPITTYADFTQEPRLLLHTPRSGRGCSEKPSGADVLPPSGSDKAQP